MLNPILSTLLLTLPGLTPASDPPPSPGTAVLQQASPFVQALEYFVQDSGRWRTPNPAYQPGNHQPREFGYVYEWDLGRRIAALRIQGHHDNGNVVDFWAYTYSFHPVERRVHLNGFSSDGRVASGYRDVCEFPEGCTFLEIVGRFGSQTTRETIEILGTDAFRSTTSELVDGQWVARAPMVWKRERPGQVLESTPPR